MKAFIPSSLPPPRFLAIVALALGCAGVAWLASGLGPDSGRQAAAVETTPAPDAANLASEDACPARELPADGEPVTGSVGLRAGGQPACDDFGRLASRIFSLTDGATGLPLPDRPGLNPSAGGLEYSVSPDNRYLVVPAMRELHVIDLRTWSEAAAIDFPEGVPLDPQAWAPDGSKLYLRLGWGSRSRTGPAIHDDRRIWELDVRSMKLARLPDLPFDSLLYPAISEDGLLLYALGFDRDDRGYHWVAKGDAFLSVVELASGREVARVPLPGLKVGADEDLVTHVPAAVLDGAGRRYYIAHADSDAITVVDLDTGGVTTTTASANEGEGLTARLLNGLNSLFAGTAEAKGAGFHDRQAGLSEDGSLLFVAGSDGIYAELDEPNDESAIEPAGLRVIDTRSLRVLHREEGIDQFLVSDDGRYLFGIGCASHVGRDWAPEECSGLKVLDIETMELAAHIEAGMAYLNMALTLDGRYLHLTSEGPGRAQMREEGFEACAEPCIELILDVVDVGSLRLVARQESEVSFTPIGR